MTNEEIIAMGYTLKVRILVNFPDGAPLRQGEKYYAKVTGETYHIFDPKHPKDYWHVAAERVEVINADISPTHAYDYCVFCNRPTEEEI